MKPSEILTQAYNDISFTPEDRKQVLDSIIDSIAEDIYYIKKNALFSSEAVTNPPKRREWEHEEK